MLLEVRKFNVLHRRRDSRFRTSTYFHSSPKVLYLGVYATPCLAPLVPACWERLRHDPVLTSHQSILCF
ncbi:hypothetical protein NDU88_004991 [Pleurodeles waltl]|uniref:Uncharacterized protein n=1 Tax=Pleurodeles waltl TaxID=8319 RepID=A0AAV7RIX9_PLEWA|nr:hypothetical protein NDU88_004991 [Pleurodeles waltl]